MSEAPEALYAELSISSQLFRFHLERPTFLPDVLGGCLKELLGAKSAPDFLQIIEDKAAAELDSTWISNLDLGEYDLFIEFDGCINGALHGLAAMGKLFLEVQS